MMFPEVVQVMSHNITLLQSMVLTCQPCSALATLFGLCLVMHFCGLVIDQQKHSLERQLYEIENVLGLRPT